MNRIKYYALALLVIPLTTCVRPADDRGELDREVGYGETQTIVVDVQDGQAAIRELSETTVVLWAQSPIVAGTLTAATAQNMRLELRNCMPDAVLTVNNQTLAVTDKPRSTWCVFDAGLEQGDNDFVIAPPDATEETTYRFADMGDIQTAMGQVHEVFDTISNTPDLRFVMSTGDVVERGDIKEYELFEAQLAHLNIPFFSTVGNHELTKEIKRWHDRYGRLSVHFRFKGVDFSFVDSGNASLDPNLHEQLDTWLEDGKERIHIFGTHYPLFDPVGARNAGFRSRNEASKLLVRLAEANVDLTLYGHVHSLYTFTNANIPAYISGGGGALPVRFDGIDRHFLVVEVAPEQNRVNSVEVVRVDP